LGAVGDLDELAVDAAEIGFGGPGDNEQRWRDRTMRRPFGGESRDA
jgi:hypothetical protein